MKTIHATITINITVEFDETQTSQKKVLQAIAESCDYEVKYNDKSINAKIVKTELTDVAA